jgi:hypothetical protein
MRYNHNNFKILDVFSYLDACSSSDEEYEEDDVITIGLLALVQLVLVRHCHGLLKEY